jgi:hypothetical protein
MCQGALLRAILDRLILENREGKAMIGETRQGAEIGINEDRDVREQREMIR